MRNLKSIFAVLALVSACGGGDTSDTVDETPLDDAGNPIVDAGPDAGPVEDPDAGVDNYLKNDGGTGRYCGATAATTGAFTSGTLTGLAAARAMCQTVCGPTKPTADICGVVSSANEVDNSLFVASLNTWLPAPESNFRIPTGWVLTTFKDGTQGTSSNCNNEVVTGDEFACNDARSYKQDNDSFTSGSAGCTWTRTNDAGVAAPSVTANRANAYGTDQIVHPDWKLGWGVGLEMHTCNESLPILCCVK